MNEFAYDEADQDYGVDEGGGWPELGWDDDTGTGETYAEQEARWQQEAALQEAQAAQAEAEEQQFLGAAGQLEGMLADELGRQLDAAEIAAPSPEALSLIAALAEDKAWNRDHGLELGTEKAIKAAIRAGFHADDPASAPTEMEALARWQTRRRAGGRMRSAGWERRHLGRQAQGG